MSKIYTVPELQTVLSPIFREHGVKKATLFGSYAKGAATSRSDVDLLVDSGLRGLAFFGLLERVSEALETPVDLIGLRSSRRFREAGWLSLNNKDQIVLRKIQGHIESILRYCEGIQSLQEFQSNSMRVEATVFNLMQIGELAKESLSDEVKAQLTTIPWPQLYGMRNRIVHEYSGVNMNIVWDTIQMDLPELLSELQAIQAGVE